jgi:hypothetical protein
MYEASEISNTKSNCDSINRVAVFVHENLGTGAGAAWALTPFDELREREK